MYAVNGTHCPACGADRNIKRYQRPASDQPGHLLSVVECLDCVFAWQWPLGRDAGESVSFFEQSYDVAEAGGYFDSTRRKAVAGMQLDYLEELGLSGRLLDVGCGDGVFASLAAVRGFDVIGLDVALPTVTPDNDGPDSEGRGACRFLKGGIDDLPAGELFDVVTLWDVIEHVERPAELLDAIRSRLKPGGWLVLETGNFESADRVEAGAAWWCWQLDHRWYFNPHILRRLLEQRGFGQFHFCDRVLRPGLRAQTGDFLRDLRHYFVMALRNPTRLGEIYENFRALRQVRASGRTGALGIFTIAARLTAE